MTSRPKKDKKAPRGEKFYAPACDEEDCYCKNHWPDRSGGKEVWILDNGSMSKTVRCQVSLENGDYTSCSYCERWMTDDGFPLKPEYMLCYRCFDKAKALDVVSDFFSEAWNDHEDLGDKDLKQWHTGWKKDCDNEAKKPSRSKIKSPHVLMYNIYRDYTDNEHVSEMMKSFIAKVFMQCMANIDKYYYDKEAIRRVRQEEEAKVQADYNTARKRLLCTMIPGIKKLTDEEYDKIPAKFARICTAEDVQIVNSVCKDPSVMTPSQIIQFVKFLAQDKALK